MKAAGSTHIFGDRAYVTRLRKSCTEALRTGASQFACEDPDDDEIYTVIVCHKFKKKIGFRNEKP